MDRTLTNASQAERLARLVAFVENRQLATNGEALPPFRSPIFVSQRAKGI
jgi:hypothetical protein|tara:strand:- start:2098 stop:2247 length:150 start_codon:yes stop_codon:yes gene_type:complete